MAGIDPQPCASVLLMPGSLLVFNQEAYTSCLHDIAQVQMAIVKRSFHTYNPPPAFRPSPGPTVYILPLPAPVSVCPLFCLYLKCTTTATGNVV